MFYTRNCKEYRRIGRKYKIALSIRTNSLNESICHIVINPNTNKECNLSNVITAINYRRYSGIISELIAYSDNIGYNTSLY